jgi:hypothetical protein
MKVELFMFENKEYKTPEIITKKQLNDGIKKIYEYEFYLNPRKLLTMINEDEFYFYDNNVLSIDLKKYGLICKILKSLKIEFISKKINSHPIISEHYISHLTIKLNYAMRIGGQKCWIGQFTYSNYIPENVIILINSLGHHNIYFYILNVKELLSIIDNLEIKVNIEYIDLYTELDKKILSSILEQEICMDNKYNTFKIMVGMAFSKYMTKELYEKFKYGNNYNIEKNINIEPEGNDLNYLLLENISKKISIFGIDGCMVQYDKKLFKLNINDFFKSNDKINFISYDKSYKIISNDIFIYNYLINLNLDILSNSISNLEIGLYKINIPDIIEFTFTYRSFNIKMLDLEQHEFSFNKNINIDNITNNIKINLNKFIPIGIKTNIILIIKTNSPDEPIGDEILVMTREHIFNLKQAKYN